MELSDLLHSLVFVLTRLEVPYLVTGSLATIAYGEPRFTNDIDIIAALTLSHASPFCESFPPPEYYLSSEAVTTAIRRQHQFNLIHITAGLKADIIVSRDSEFDRSRFARADFCRQVPTAKPSSPRLRT